MQPVFQTDSLPLYSPQGLQKRPGFFLGLIFHFGLGYLGFVRGYGLLFFYYAYIAFSLYYCVFGSRVQVLKAIFYSVGVEVFWRMTEASLFYEFGKVFLIGMLSIGFVRWRQGTRHLLIPTFYLSLLIPSLFVRPEISRQELSFNLSGPVCLVFSLLFFYAIRASRREVEESIRILVFPVFSIFTVCLYSTVTASDIVFSESVFETSGGFGPNQVSSILGLGAFGALIGLNHNQKKLIYGALLVLIFVFLTQVILTFSRGGFYTGIIAMAVFLIPQIKNEQWVLFKKNVFLALLLLILSVLLLNKTTNSAYKDRFSDFNATGRSQIARFEMKAFFENPLLGLGPGGAKIYRSEMDLAQASHTEYTRLLAEHGLFGLACILIQIYLLFRILLSKVSAKDKMLSFSLMLWAVLFMTHAGMRLAAPAVLFGLGAAGLSGAKSVKTATGFRPKMSRSINWPERQ